MASEPIKEADSNWQKKAGFDLRQDKTKILKEALASAEENGQSLPKTDSAQVFQRMWGSKKSAQSDECIVSWKYVKRKALKMLRVLRKYDDPEMQRKKLRAVEGILCLVLPMSGFCTDSEADEVVDAYIYCQESPSLHPLQTAFPTGYLPRNYRRLVDRCGVYKCVLFAHPSLRSALARRGHFLNSGRFSSSESMQLMTNFDEFLRSRGYATDPESKWNLIKSDFSKFYRKTKLFLHVGKKLNRSSDQLRARLIWSYHTLKRSRLNAEEDSFVLREAAALKSRGVHKRFKRIGGELGRIHAQVASRHQHLTLSKFAPSDPRKLFESVANLGDTNLDDIPFHTLAAENGMSENDLRLYWSREGKKQYLRSKLPKWTLEDTIKLLDKIQESGEDEENCVDFEGIFERHFKGQVADAPHLREHFNRIRRVVPYYMLDDLQSVVSVAKKHVKKRMRKRKPEESSVEGETEDLEHHVEGDEDMFED